jgi:hypothetical protein
VYDLVPRTAAGAQVARCGFGAVADGDGADRLVVIGDAERRPERADRLRHDTEVQRGQALVDHGEQDQQRGHPGIDVPERHRFRSSPVSTRNAWPCENPADGPRTALLRIRSRLSGETGSSVNSRTMCRRRTTSENSTAG